MKINILSLSIVMLLLGGCDQASSLITETTAQCDQEVTKKGVTERFSQDVTERAHNRVKELIANEDITVDMGKLRSALQHITFNVLNVRTNHSDPNSNKKYCVTEFVVKIPESIIKDADTSRAVMEETNVAQTAVLSDLKFENNQLSRELEYWIQPTDDGQKMFIHLENADGLSLFLADVVIDALLKSARQNAVEVAQQEEMKRIAEENATVEAYQALLLTEAKAKIDQANEHLNLVWNATSKDVRDALLAEQKIWLKKRELECKLNSSAAEHSEVARLNCEAQMTQQRTNELRHKIYELEL